MKRPKQRAPIPETDARPIADEFIARQVGHLPELEGARYRSAPEPMWIFFYKIPLYGTVVVDPSHWIVEVLIETKAARFFFAM